MRNLATIGLLALATGTYAQYSSNYFEVNLGGGIQTLTYSPESNGISKTAGLGGQFGIGYKHFFNDHIGVGFGLGAAFFNSYANLNFVELSDQELDGTKFKLESEFSDFDEKQKYGQIEIPIGFYYQRDITYGLNFIAGAGVKVGFPFRASYAQTSGFVNQSQIYSDISTDKQPLGDPNVSSDFRGDYRKAKTTCGLFLDFGINKWFKNGLGVYVGAYVNYFFTDVMKESTNKILDVNRNYNGVLNSDQVTDVHLISAGLKVALEVPMQKKKQKSEANKEILADEPMMSPETRDSIIHQPDSLLYVRYSREEVRKVKHLIAAMPSIENVDDNKKKIFKQTIEAYDTLTSFEKLDITWSERGKLKQADYAINAEDRLVEICKSMSEEIKFPFAQSGFVSTSKLEQEFEDLAFILKLLPDAVVDICGYADSKEYDNDPSLSKERAMFLRDILMKKGIGGDQIKSKDMGKEGAADPNAADDVQSENRKVVLIPRKSEF